MRLLQCKVSPSGLHECLDAEEALAAEVILCTFCSEPMIYMSEAAAAELDTWQDPARYEQVDEDERYYDS